MFCPSCGEELPEGTKFCKNCGKEISNIQTSNAVQTQGAENDHKIAIIAGYILAILIPLIGLIIGIYLYTRKDSENAQKHAKYIILVAAIVWFISFMLMMN
ncbi:zinc ribbon domain-containing protein [Methanobrevibacter sp.]|uniref:zinc ribbon domain-containing protein n=1 Tax=Methanobrevibacter sp. TaxID=66852 RepID=UPI0025F1ECC9|nr:zinc ribbon domain-containing protein [Methanobrevibacter sp.]MBR4447923.1 zinc ribbon domain-containing protein [Methanobrevibacter sp.]